MSRWPAVAALLLAGCTVATAEDFPPTTDGGVYCTDLRSREILRGEACHEMGRRHNRVGG